MPKKGSKKIKQIKKIKNSESGYRNHTVPAFSFQSLSGVVYSLNNRKCKAESVHLWWCENQDTTEKKK